MTETEKRIIKILIDNHFDYIKREVEKKDFLYSRYFGCCDVCGNEGIAFNVGRNNYFRCDEHKKVWHIGSNEFPSWRDENEEIWKSNMDKYNDYERIDGFEFIKARYPEEKENYLEELPEHLPL